MGVAMHCQKPIIFILTAVCLLLSIAVGDNEYAVVPLTNNTFPFQGYLTDYLGRSFYGTVVMGFEFYTNEDGTNNIVYGAETGLIRKVKVYNGLYATKISLPPDAFAKLASYDNLWVKVYLASASSSGLNWNDASKSIPPLKDEANMLSPLVQLTAAPYALGVRGLAYQKNNSQNQGVLKIGEAYIATTNIGAASNNKENLIISGNVGIGTRDATAAKLVIAGADGIKNESDMEITGTLSAPGGVVGAVWN
jgi:hypothetical protein